MDINASGDGGFDVDWTTDDELEIGSEPGPLALTDAIAGSRDVNIQASTSGGDSGLKLINHFVGMGFSEKLVVKAIEETGEGDAESILNTILTYSTLEDSPEQQLSQHSDPSSLDYNEVLPEDLSDMESWSEDEIEEKPMSDKHKELLALASIGSLSEKDQKLLDLLNMGYSAEEALIAIDRSAPGASVADLIDCIFSAQIAREESCYLPDDDLKPRHLYSGSSSCNNKKRKHIDMRRNNVIEDAIRFPNPMIGFGVPSEQPARVHRTLPERARGRPYFYYENVALTPKGVWHQISRFLYDIEPEFVDSKFFCAAARKRGYVHNLPIENRFPLVPLPPLTVQQAFPLSRRWWPAWDPRDKLNCLQTAMACAKLTERLRGYLERYDGEPPDFIQKKVLYECRKWNLVWVGRNKLAPLEPDEVEMLLGFPKNHTRGGGISRTDRFKSLGNSFQVDTVAYHLSVLKDMFPNGINVLSLFSGIGGAEVALHRLGIKLKNVVCVEISKVNRDIVRSWWEQTNQTGNLYDYEDVELMDGDRLDQIMDMIGGGFDLIIGGSPCNNLAGSNRVSRDGLEGAESRLFFDYFRILDLVKNLMQDRQL